MAADVEGEVADHFEAYVEAFFRDEIEACLRYFSIPLLLVTERGVLALSSREAFVSQWDESRRALRQRGVVRSAVAGCKVFALAPAMAVASVRYDRSDQADGLVERIAGTYSLHKGDEGWRIVTAMMHGPETWLGELGRL